MDGCPGVLKDKRRQGAHNQPDTHAGNLDLSVAPTCTDKHGYDLAGSLLFSGNHGLADPFLFLWREKSFRVDHLTNSPRLRRPPKLPPPPPNPPPPTEPATPTEAAASETASAETSGKNTASPISSSSGS